MYRNEKQFLFKIRRSSLEPLSGIVEQEWGESIR